MSRCTFRIRSAEESDTPQLSELIEAGNFAAGSPGGRQIRGQEMNASLSDRLMALIDDPARSVLVAVDEQLDRLIGLVVLSVDQVAAINPVSVLTMSHLYVDDSQRRRGVGRALMAAAVQEADRRGIDHLVATALHGSREVNRYLARLGFAPMVTRRIASTQVLRRALGIAEAPDRVARLRRLRTARVGEAVRVSGRAARRGA